MAIWFDEVVFACDTFSSISELSEDEMFSQHDIDLLKVGGFQNFSISTKSVSSAIITILDALLPYDANKTSDLGAVIICSNSLRFAQSADTTTDPVSSCLATVRSWADQRGLRQVRILYANNFDCTNTLAALASVMEFVRAAPCQPVLLVSTDRVFDCKRRIGDRGTTIFSDVAAGLIVTGQNARYMLSDIIMYNHRHRSCGSPSGGGIPNPIDLIQSLELLEKEIIRRCGDLSEFDLVILDNFSDSMIDFFIYALRLNPRVACTPSRREHGHAFSMDWMLSLKTLEFQNALWRGMRIGVLNVGDFNLAFMSLVVTDRYTT